MLLAEESARRPRCGLRVAVQHIGVKIDTVRPTDCPRLVGDLYPGEVIRVPQGLKDPTAAHDIREVEISHQAVAEGQAEPVPTQRFHRRNARQVSHRPFRLPEALDREERFRGLRSIPVSQQLFAMQRRPLGEKPRRGAR